MSRQPPPAPAPEPALVGGLDLGQAGDFTALAVLEQTQLPDPECPGAFVGSYAVRHLERFPLGTPYAAPGGGPSIVGRVEALFGRPPLSGCPLAVDQTGVGRAVVEMFRASGRLYLVPVTITAGFEAAQGEEGWRVPKKDLVSTLQILFQARRLRISRRLPEARTLEKELLNFRVKVTAAANETFGAWREGQHDDLVLAVALAAWAGERACIRGEVSVEDPSRGVIARAPRGVFLEDPCPRDPEAPRDDDAPRWGGLHFPF